jgi:sarcosine oxidase, subunit gamma
VPEPTLQSFKASDGEILAVRDLLLRRVDFPIAILRIWKPEASDIAALENAFGTIWPDPNKVTGHPKTRIGWLGPHEWAIVNQPVEQTRDAVRRVLTTGLFHVADTTDGRATFMVSGANATDILAKGCSLDLDPDGFGPGSCAQTLLAELPIWLEHLPSDETPGPLYFVHVDRSVEHWARAWLLDAAKEFAS